MVGVTWFVVLHFCQRDLCLRAFLCVCLGFGINGMTGTQSYENDNYSNGINSMTYTHTHTHTHLKLCTELWHLGNIWLNVDNNNDYYDDGNGNGNSNGGCAGDDGDDDDDDRKMQANSLKENALCSFARDNDAYVKMCVKKFWSG